MAVQETISAYAFGPFVLNLRDRLLYRTGLPVDVHAKVYEILRCLVLSGDRLVTKERLVEDVWGGSPIGDNNIAQHMHLVREVLDDLTKPYRFIETVHGRGYRLLIEPRPVLPTSAEPYSQVEPAVVSHSLAAELHSNAAFFMTMGTPAALESSAQLCRKALEIDPSFADAHAAIAISAMLKAAFLFGVPLQQYDVARRHANQALTLEPRCARAHLVIAALALLDEHAPAEAQRHLDAAAALLPDYAGIGILRILSLSAQGLHVAARAAAMNATTINPSSSMLGAYAAFAAYHSGDLESAAAMLERLLVFRPGAAFATYMLGLTRLAQGEYARARDAFQTLLAGRVSVIPAYEKFRQRATAAMAFIEARSGSFEDARALAKDVQRNPQCSYVALALARAGAREEDSVLACLEHAREQRDPWFPFVAEDPAFREFRDIPEFSELVRLRTQA